MAGSISATACALTGTRNVTEDNDETRPFAGTTRQHKPTSPQAHPCGASCSLTWQWLCRILRVTTQLQAIATEVSVTSWDEEEAEELGPAAKATLRALDWASLTGFVSDFASTRAGKQACQQLQVPKLLSQWWS